MIGEAVLVAVSSGSTTDALGNEVPQTRAVEVGNVLVAPGAASGTGGDNRPDRRWERYTLYFPSDWDGDVSGGTVTVRGTECRVVGVPAHWPDSPTEWRWVVEVEATHG